MSTPEQRTTVKICYVLYLIGLFTGGIFLLVGVILAYLNRDKASDWIIESHFDFLIRTFWIWLYIHIVPVIVGVILFIVMPPMVFVFLVLAFIFYIVMLIYYFIKLLSALNGFEDGEPAN